ncbi:MAG: acyl-CoA reductase-like NAD-dependent aldehyde dehydrogenase [Glaciecola sp.]|jgi:acyl-CoA reductase-like NAD-dependent aldehyde dehydrogenase
MTASNETTVGGGGAIVIPEAKAHLAHATEEELDVAVKVVGDNAQRWVELSIPDRLAMIEETINSVVDTSERWADLAMKHKGIAPGSAYEGEDMSWGPMLVARTLRLLKKTLRDLDKHGEVKLPGKPYTRDNGQVVVPVFPPTLVDRALFPMVTGELWLEPEVTISTIETARAYKVKQPGRVCFVLGAGNVTSIGAIDVLQKLFIEDQVCVLKMNPANEWIGPIIKLALAPFIREGYVRVVFGGVSQGAYLCEHEGVDTLHMTGSDKTHDAIVFGVGEEGQRRKTADDPINTKPFSTELGNVSPVIVVPGPWSEDDLEYQAKQAHGMINANGGFNCGSMRVLLTHESWDQRDLFLDQLKLAMQKAEDRTAFYPGARDRWETFTKAHPNAIHYGNDLGANAPITLLPGLDASVTDDIAFRVESFNGVFGEAPIPAADAAEYLAKATAFCNDTLWGTLGVTIIVHPKSLKDPKVKAALEAAIADLRYGAIAVNIWSGLAYGLGTTIWGAFPGHVRNDIQTGQGWVRNTLMIEKPQKCVIRAPWKLGKKPPTSYDFSTMGSLARRLVQVEAYGDLTQLPGIVSDGIKA